MVNKLTTQTDQSQYCIDHCFRKATVTESLETEFVVLSVKEQCGVMRKKKKVTVYCGARRTEKCFSKYEDSGRKTQFWN